MQLAIDILDELFLSINESQQNSVQTVKQKLVILDIEVELNLLKK
jgi:hypothetical protein